MHSNIKTTLAAVCLSIVMTGCSAAEQVKQNESTAETTQTTTATTEGTTAAVTEEVTSAETEATPTETEEASAQPTDNALSENDTVEQMAEKLENKYGVDIVYGEDIRTRFDEDGEDLRAEKYTDENGIKTAMISVDTALGIFPQGLTMKLVNDDKSPLKIYLTGAVGQGGEAPEPGALPAFTDDEDEELYLAIDISTDGEINVPTVSHELTHVIDFKLHAMGAFDDSKWDSLNPEGFSYTEDYENYRSSEFADKYSYTKEHYVQRILSQDADDVYFYYNYSLVNAYEDRATLMEDLWVYLMWDFEIAPGIYSFPHVKEKAEFFLDRMCEAFELSDSDVEKWHNALEQLSTNSAEAV